MSLSIVTVCKNDDIRLDLTIKSLKSQASQSFEHIIIKHTSAGCPGDWYEDTFHDSTRYATRIFKFHDHGIYMAMNLGLCRAQSSSIIYLNCGDTLYCDSTVTTLLGLIDQKSSTHYVAPFFYAHNLKVPQSYNLVGFHDPVQSFRKGALICQQATIYNRHSVIRLGGFDQSFRLAGDYELFCRIILSGQKVSSLPLVISKYEAGGLSETFSRESGREKSRLGIRTHHYSQHNPIILSNCASSA
jgi:hypothetical protein